MKYAWLSCMVSPGQFSCEYAVDAEMHTGTRFVLFAAEEDVQFQKRPTRGERIPGWLRVEVLKTDGSLALVQLPQHSLENGDILTVKLDDLRVAAELPELVR